ncbi:MAG TPA: hypothetical protein VET23_12720 [Chitinophagaceae bacterium]|nr:hypothetical protein [Chitinophagaceae bacterium]
MVTATGQFQTAEPSGGTSFANVTIPGYSQSWINIAYANADNDNYASFGNLSQIAGAYTDYLMITGFGFNIPHNAMINGIKIRIDQCATK